MVEHDIKKILSDMDIPEPDEKARETAVEAALAEFSKQNVLAAKKNQGFKKSDRLTGTFLSKLTLIGEGIMKRRYIWPSAITACLILLVFGITQLREESRQVSSDVQSVGTPVLLEEKSKDFLVKPTEDYNQEVAAEEAAPAPMVATKLDSIASMPAPAQSPKGYQPQRQELKKTRITLSKEKGSAATNGYAGDMRKSDMLNAPQTVTVMETESLEQIMPVPDDMVSNDNFEGFKQNPVKLVESEPVSTFSIDVDTASYAFVRKMLNQGVLPPKDSVRVEELINYFDYDYALPKDKSKPFLPTVAVYPTPWNPDTKLIHIGIRGYDVIPEQRPKSNLVFLLDVSGSMRQPDKLPLLKNAFRMLVENLQDTDTVSIVVYAGAAGTVLEPTPVKEKRKILAALEKLRAGGSTAGGEGIRQAYALAEANFLENGVNRVILATDGDFNVGITNPNELQGFVERKRQTGIFLSIIGFGQGNYNDALMQKLAQNGNGNASYIDNLNEARKVLVEEASSTLFTIAKDVKIQVEFNPAKVREYRLIGYESRLLKREDFNNDQVDAGEIGSGHRVTAIYEIAEPGSKGLLVDDLRFSKKANQVPGSAQTAGEYAFLKIRYKEPQASKSQLMTMPISTQQEYKSRKSVPAEIQFAGAVAAYGQLLRQDPYTKGFSFDDVIDLALKGRGEDRFGFRGEFINLCRLAKSAAALKSQ